MKWAFRNKTAEKKTENGDFQVVGSLLYAHYPIYSFFYSNNITKSYVL